MHIAFFNRSFFPDISATSQLLTELCEDLVHTYGCRVSVVAGVPLLTAEDGERPSRFFVPREQYRGIDIWRMPGTRLSKENLLGRSCNYLSYFLSACYMGLRLERPDVIVSLTDPPLIGLAAYLAARRFKVPLIMSYRDIYPEVAWLLDAVRGRVAHRMLHEVNRFLVRKADRVIALGETMRHRLIERKDAEPAKTVVIPDWADCQAIVPGPKRNPFSIDHDLADKFVVMHAGNIGLSQGLETLIQAATYLRHKPDIRIVLVGDGVKRRALEAQARRLQLTNVRFYPFQPQAQLAQVFASADMFVVALKPGLAGYIVPSKLYSILAAGRPYVAAVDAACEVTAITQQHQCGLWVEPGEPQRLADQILTLYQQRDMAWRLGQNARRAAMRFDRRRHVQSYYELFCDYVQDVRPIAA